MLCAFACMSANSCQRRIALPFYYYYVCSISLLNFPCTSSTFFLDLYGNLSLSLSLSLSLCLKNEYGNAHFVSYIDFFALCWKWSFYCSFPVKEGVEVVMSYLEKVHTSIIQKKTVCSKYFTMAKVFCISVTPSIIEVLGVGGPFMQGSFKLKAVINYSI